MLTAWDMVERLADYQGIAQGDEVDLRRARRSIVDAIAEWPRMHNWTYYSSVCRIVLVAPYATGTVAYNASTRELTLTGGTWPTWAAEGEVRIGEVRSRVASRSSGTVLVMASAATFVADISSGTSYELYPDGYQLPAGFRSAGSLTRESPWEALTYLTPDAFQVCKRRDWGTDDSMVYTVMAGRTPSTYRIYVHPPASQAETLDFSYLRVPVAPSVWESSVGRVSMTNGSPTVIGTGTAFHSGMVGARFRVSATASIPTGYDGTFPPLSEHEVASVSSATSLTLATNATESSNSVGYRISSPIDIDEGTMLSAFTAWARMLLARDMKNKDTQATESQAVAALNLARAADSRSMAPKASLRYIEPAYDRSSRFGPDIP